MTRLRLALAPLALLVGLTAVAADKPSSSWAPRAVWKGHAKHGTTLVFSPDGKTLAAASDALVKLYDVKSGKEKPSLRGRRLGVLAVSFSADGSTLTTVGRDGYVRVWETATGRQRSSARLRLRDALQAAAFSPDGKLLATTADSMLERRPAGEVQVWEVPSCRLRARLPHQWPTRHFTFTADGKTLVAGEERYVITPDGPTPSSSVIDVHVWDLAKSKITRTLKAAGYFSLSPDGKALAAVTYEAVGKKSTYTIRVWDVGGGKEKAACKGDAGYVPATAFAPDGKLLASGGSDKAVRLWDPATGKALAALTGHGGTVAALAFTKDGKVLATAGDDGTVRLWDAPAK